MRSEHSWADHRVKALEVDHPYPRNRSGKTPKYMDGTNVRAKTCECKRSQLFESNEGRCVLCGREPKLGSRRLIK